jgi:hypothetical protein
VGGVWGGVTGVDFWLALEGSTCLRCKLFLRYVGVKTPHVNLIENIGLRGPFEGSLAAWSRSNNAGRLYVASHRVEMVPRDGERMVGPSA